MNNLIGEENRTSALDVGLAERLNQKAKEEDKREELERRKEELEKRIKEQNRIEEPKESIKPTEFSPSTKINQQPSTIIEPRYLTLDNIACVDNEGHVFEKYDRIFFQEKPVHYSDERVVCKSKEEWIDYHGARGAFLPSCALLCNILVRLWKGNPQEKETAIQILHSRSRFGMIGISGIWLATNTKIDYQAGLLLNYCDEHTISYNLKNIKSFNLKSEDSGDDPLVTLLDYEELPKINLRDVFTKGLTNSMEERKKTIIRIENKFKRLNLLKSLTGLDENGLRVLYSLGEYISLNRPVMFRSSYQPHDAPLKGCGIGGYKSGLEIHANQNLEGNVNNIYGSIGVKLDKS